MNLLIMITGFLWTCFLQAPISSESHSFLQRIDQTLGLEGVLDSSLYAPFFPLKLYFNDGDIECDCAVHGLLDFNNIGFFFNRSNYFIGGTDKSVYTAFYEYFSQILSQPVDKTLACLRMKIIYTLQILSCLKALLLSNQKTKLVEEMDSFLQSNDLIRDSNNPVLLLNYFIALSLLNIGLILFELENDDCLEESFSFEKINDFFHSLSESKCSEAQLFSSFGRMMSHSF